MVLEMGHSLHRHLPAMEHNCVLSFLSDFGIIVVYNPLFLAVSFMDHILFFHMRPRSGSQQDQTQNK